MQPQEFLAAVLPTSGHYCAVELTTKKRQHVFVDDLYGLDDAIQQLSAEPKNTYFALASFVKTGSREADNAALMRSLFIDLDIGTGEKTYPNKKAAVSALQQFLVDTKLNTLGAPWLVDSGGGVHAYWPLEQDASIAEWRPVAKAFKDRAKEHGFKIDMTVTADAARVLRPPGTLNHKYDPPRPVVLKFRGAIFSLAAIGALLGALTKPAEATELMLPGKRPSAVVLSPIMQALSNNSITLFKNIMVKTAAGTGCGQIAYYAAHATEDGMEPLWRGLLSIAIKCDDGQKAAMKLSLLHPYDIGRMQQKINEIKGPYACTKLDAENPGICGNCPHWNRITNPLALGRETLAQDTVEEYTEENSPLPPGAHLTPPTLPRGYTYGNGGGIYYRQESEVAGIKSHKDVLLLPYNFFMVDSLREGSVFSSRFAAVRKNSVTYVTVPSKAAGSKEEVIKALAGQNIIAAFGTGNDKNLFDYVRTCIGEASATDSALSVPPNMGWQPDGGFAISDQVVLPGSQTYTFVSDKLTNIINATTTRGTLGDWQRVMHMLQLKEQWGILFFAGIAFGSPLMQWVDEGTPGMTYLACGKTSGAGKSLALSMCASVWGSPTNYLIKPTTSERTMLQRAGLLGNLPLIVDEVTNKSRESKNEWVPAFAFDLSQGGHKLKGSGASNTELDNNLFWKLLAALSSNDPQMEAMMGARDNTSEGEVRRMLEWVAAEEVQWTDSERDVLELLKHNFGVAGRTYIKWIIEHPDVAKEVLVATQKKWRTMMVAKDSERFWNAGNSAVIAGCILAGPQYANVFAFDSHAIAMFAKSMVTRARNIISINQRSAEDILNAYTRDFHGQLVKYAPNEAHGLAIFNDGRAITKDSARGRIAGRVEYNVIAGWTDYYIETSMLKRYCAQYNWGFTDLIRELQKTLVVVASTRKNLLSRTNGPEMFVACVKISQQHVDEPPEGE